MPASYRFSTEGLRRSDSPRRSLARRFADHSVRVTRSLRSRRGLVDLTRWRLADIDCLCHNMRRDPIPPGTLHLLILKTLARAGELHGFEVAESIERLSGEVLTVEEGSLYPALQRMLLKGWLIAEWGTTADNRRA